LKDVGLDFFMLCSSIGAITGPFGQVGYSAANAFLDAFAACHFSGNGGFTVSINWDAWQEVGMAFKAIKDMENINNISISLSDGLLPQQGIEIFNRILKWNQPQVVVSTVDMETRIEQSNKTDLLKMAEDSKKSKNTPLHLHSRPKLSNPYTAPCNEVEETIAAIWQNYLGIEKVGIHDNFFDLGVTSMDIMQVNAKLQETLKRNIRPVEMFTYPTINSLTQHLIQEENGEFSLIEANNRTKKVNKGKQSLQNRFKIRRIK
jgi:acyl carrier protein